MRCDRAAKRVVVKDQPDLHGGHKKHDGCKHWTRDYFHEDQGPPANRISSKPCLEKRGK